MTYPEAIEFLSGFNQFGMRLGLDNIIRLAQLAGNPQESLRFIHVAGTNGKGSTCAFLESVYRCSGLRVGLFTSPHLVRFGERIQINRRPLSDLEIVNLIERLKPWTTSQSNPDVPTFFEISTLMALLHFREHRCDVVVWETGLGGRLDATNIVSPLASVITNIGFDHMQWLGHSLPEIAKEKAGIIKPGIPVLTATDNPEALQVIQETAQRLGCPLTIVSATQTQSGVLKDLELSLQGEHQRLNASLATATVGALQSVLPVHPVALRSGLASAHWPGRLQHIERAGQSFLLDGAHNLEAAWALRTALEKRFPARRPVFLLGFLRDKPWKEMLEILSPLAARIAFVPVKSTRTAVPAELLSTLQSLSPQTPAESFANLSSALRATNQEPFVVVTGSLYLVGEALEQLSSTTSDQSEERALNEWQKEPRTPG